MLVERELLDDAGYFDERLKLFEDHDLWLRLACLSEVAVVPRPLVKVRRHDEHYSGRDELRGGGMPRHVSRARLARADLRGGTHRAATHSRRARWACRAPARPRR